MIINALIFLNPIIFNPIQTSNIIQDYGPIITSLIGPLLAVFCSVYYTNHRNQIKMDENREIIAKALISELKYIYYDINHTFLTIAGFYNKTANEFVTQEDIEILKKQTDYDVLNGIISILKNDKTTNFDYILMFQNINKDIFLFKQEDCFAIVNFYYFLRQKNSMLKFTLERYYSDSIDKMDKKLIHSLIITYLDDTKNILIQNEKIRKKLDIYVRD